MARKREGSLYLTSTGYRARVTVEVDGESVRKVFDLKTKSKAAARIKLKRLLSTGDMSTQEEAAREETFKEAAERIVGKSKIRSKENRLSRLRNHVFEHIGEKPVSQVTAPDVLDVLDIVAERGFSKDLVVHVKADISSVLKVLLARDLIPSNVTEKLKGNLPEAVVDKRERAVLTDEEFAHYISWEHPIPGRRLGTLERQTMACVSRMFGGLRVGDILALRWESLDTQNGQFRAGWAPRLKTARPQLLEIPEMLRPILRDWWERHDRPTKGPVFPAQRGERAGEKKTRANYAAGLRRDLRRALGIEEMQRIPIVRRNGKPDHKVVWVRVRELDDREVQLFEPTEFTKPVDFHSFRRGYKQGLADAGVELQAAMTLSGATDAKTHQRYLRNTAQMRTVPEAALPRLSIRSLQPHPPKAMGRAFSGSVAERLSLTDEHTVGYESASLGQNYSSAVHESRAHNSAVECNLHTAGADVNTGELALPENADSPEEGNEKTGSGQVWLNAVPFAPDTEAALVNALSAATAAGQWDVVTMLAEELRARRLAKDGIPSLDAARKKGGAA